MSLVLAGLVAAALAQTPTPAAPAPDPAAQITVYGPAALRQQRAVLVRAFKDLGWRKGRETEGQIVFRPPKGQAWMGRAILDYDGTLEMRRPVVAFRSAELQNPTPYDANPHFDRDPGGMLYPTDDGGTAWATPNPSGTFWILPSWRFVGPAHQRVREVLDPELTEYRAIVEATAEAANE